MSGVTSVDPDDPTARNTVRTVQCGTGLRRQDVTDAQWLIDFSRGIDETIFSRVSVLQSEILGGYGVTSAWLGRFCVTPVHFDGAVVDLSSAPREIDFADHPRAMEAYTRFRNECAAFRQRGGRLFSAMVVLDGQIISADGRHRNSCADNLAANSLWLDVRFADGSTRNYLVLVGELHELAFAQ